MERLRAAGANLAVVAVEKAANGLELAQIECENHRHWCKPFVLKFTPSSFSVPGVVSGLREFANPARRAVG